MQSRFLFVSTSTLFVFLTSHAYFRFSVDFVVHFFNAIYNHKICRFFCGNAAFFGQANDWKNGCGNQTSAPKNM